MVEKIKKSSDISTGNTNDAKQLDELLRILKEINFEIFTVNYKKNSFSLEHSDHVKQTKLAVHAYKNGYLVEFTGTRTIQLLAGPGGILKQQVRVMRLKPRNRNKKGK